MNGKNCIIVIPKRKEIGDPHFPILDLETIVNPSLTLCKIRDMFRLTTGLDLFLFFKNQPMGKWKEEPFSKHIQLPRLCQLIRNNPMGLARCLASHQSMQKKAVECNRPLCQRCHAGLNTIHFPVSIIDKGTGDLQTVCALDHGDRRNASLQIEKRIADLEITKNEITNALDDLRILSKSKTHCVIGWLELIADYLSELSNRPILSNENGQVSPGIPTPDHHSTEYKVRLEIGRSISLPSWRAQRSSGLSASIVERTIEFVDRYYGLDLSTQVIAQALGFDPSYFAKVFKEHARESLTSYIKRVRLIRAQKLLKDPYLSILEIAERTGFSDASYFTRVFRNAFGITPTQFRQISNLSSE